MYKNTIRIDGMACGMCESHICDAIRKAFPDARKVKASHRKKVATFQTDVELSADTVKSVIEATGYHYLGFDTEEA